MKINQLKAAVEKYKDREDLALLVTDRWVIARVWLSKKWLWLFMVATIILLDNYIVRLWWQPYTARVTSFAVDP